MDSTIFHNSNQSQAVKERKLVSRSNKGVKASNRKNKLMWKVLCLTKRKAPQKILNVMGEHIGQTCENEEEIMDDLDEWFVKESDSKDKGEEDCDFYGAKFSYEEYVPGSAVSR
jgi:hypothetical protein